MWKLQIASHWLKLLILICSSVVAIKVRHFMLLVDVLVVTLLKHVVPNSFMNTHVVMP